MKTNVIPLVQNLQYRRILADIDAGFGAWADLSGDSVKCGRGCDACCHGPFDVSGADLWLALEALADLKPETQRGVLARVAGAAAAQRAWLGEHVPSTATPSLERLGEDRFDAMCDALVAAPCPLLDEGTCLVYEARPEACRYRGATWEDDGEVLEMGCPEGWNDEAPPARGLWIDVSGRVARLERRSYAAVNEQRERTTLALGLDALLRRS